MKLYVSASALVRDIRLGISTEKLDESLYALFFSERSSTLGAEGFNRLRGKTRLDEETFYTLEGAIMFAEQQGRAVWVSGDKLQVLSNFLVVHRLKALNLKAARVDNYTALEEVIRETNPGLEVIWRLR